MEEKGEFMSKNRSAKAVAAAAGFFLLFATPGLTSAQTSPSGRVPTPHTVSPAAGPKADPSQTDYFAGLKLSDEQQAKIDEIRRDMRVRREAVVKDERLDAAKKDAMLNGYRYLENGQVFEVLTPEQQSEVRKKVAAQRAAQRQQKPSQSK
jgi:Spy/CpxP family protein refolding chaperone